MLSNQPASLIATSQRQSDYIANDVLPSLTCGADLFTANGWSNEVKVDGHIHNCFKQAIHIRLDDGRLLTLLCGTAQYGMRVINVAESVWVKLQQLVAPNDKITLVTNALQHQRFTLVWQQQNIWRSPSIAACFNHTSGSVLSNNLGYAQQWLTNALSNQGTDKNLLWQNAYANFRQVVNALGDNSTNLDAAVYRTIGLGLGLTPSGDDMLAGLLLGLIAGSDRDKTSARIVGLSTLISQYAIHTTYASQDSFEQAIQGWLTASLADVLITLHSTDTQALTKALASQSAIGHHSGLDSLIGLFAGLEFALALQPIDQLATSLILSA